MALERMDPAALQTAVQQAGENWLAGITSVSELSDAEKRLRLGATPPPGEPSLQEREAIAAANRGAAAMTVAGAPAAYDLRNVDGLNFITSVRDQGGCGSGVAFGSAATVEGTFRRQRGDPNLAVDFSEAHLFYCIARAQGRNCSNGWWCDKSVDAFKTDGVVDEACYPYTARDQNCSNRCADWQSRLTKISNWHEITSVAEMKEWIATRGPLSCAFSVYNDFFSYRSGVYRHVSGGLAGGHCVSCVGYNDAGGYWICKNSWGPGWGDNGYFCIAYGECGIDAKMWAVDGIVETGWGRKVIEPAIVLPRAQAPGSTGPVREITVTGHTLGDDSASRFREGGIYKLRFGVGPPREGNLAAGYIGVSDIPEGGLRTHWVVTSRDVQFVPELSTSDVRRIGESWVASFDLLIPERGSSETAEIAILAAGKRGSVLVTIYAVSAQDQRELYREVTVALEGAPSVKADATCTSPLHTHLSSTHEWTTPPEHVQVTITNGVATVTTKRRRLEDYDFTEPFGATDSLVAGAIQNLRSALERLREAHTEYLDDLDPLDMARRLQYPSWHLHFDRGNGWQPFPYDADAAHGDAFDRVHRSAEWRAFASAGYALFDRCFPKGTQLRALIERLLPGSRIDFHWTERSGAGWVSHVPWALMFMEAPEVTGQTPADPELFLGIRFRIGARAWRVDNGSVVLGAPDETHAMHLLYWGNQPRDDVGAEARWQEMEYRKWASSTLVPDSALPDLKKQIIIALDAPAPSPVAVLYFYCHCSVGDGAQPCLRFGNTSKSVDVLDLTDLSQKDLPDAPFIFANACTSAQADPHMTSELEQRFFSRGVRAFIGSETKVPVKLASKFAWLFFRFLYREADLERKPMTVGEALTQARMFLWTQYRNVGGLFYSVTNQYDLYLASKAEVLALR